MAETRREKAVLSIVCVAIVATLLNAGPAIDAFIPKHVAVGYQAFATGDIPDNSLANQVPGFYAFVSVLLLIPGIDPQVLVHFPVQVVPYAVVFFTLVYALSDGNTVIAGVLTALQLFISSSATWRVYLWPHGLGDILFFTIAIGLIVLYRRRASYRTFVALLACGVAVVYVSYNMTAVATLLLLGAYAFLKLGWALRGYLNLDDRLGRTSVQRVTLVVPTVMIAAVLLSDFFQQKFVPLVASGFREANLARFMFTWLGASRVRGSEITHLLVTEPAVIRWVAIVRYAVVALVIVLFVLSVAWKVSTYTTITVAETLLLAYLFAITLYFVARVYVGAVDVAAFYTPGVLALAYLYARYDGTRLAVPLVLLLVVLTASVVGTQVANDRYDQIDDTAALTHQMEGEHAWIDEYAAATPNRQIRGDELTVNLLVLGDLIESDAPAYGETRAGYQVMDPGEAAAITTYEEPRPSEYYVMNSDLRSMSLQNWRNIGSWDRNRDAIHGNTHANKVYSEGEVWVFLS